VWTPPCCRPPSCCRPRPPWEWTRARRTRCPCSHCMRTRSWNKSRPQKQWPCRRPSRRRRRGPSQRTRTVPCTRCRRSRHTCSCRRRSCPPRPWPSGNMCRTCLWRWPPSSSRSRPRRHRPRSRPPTATLTRSWVRSRCRQACRPCSGRQLKVWTPPCCRPPSCCRPRPPWEWTRARRTRCPCSHCMRTRSWNKSRPQKQWPCRRPSRRRRRGPSQRTRTVPCTRCRRSRHTCSCRRRSCPPRPWPSGNMCRTCLWRWPPSSSRSRPRCHLHCVQGRLHGRAWKLLVSVVALATAVMQGRTPHLPGLRGRHHQRPSHRTRRQLLQRGRTRRGLSSPS